MSKTNKQTFAEQREHLRCIAFLASESGGTFLRDRGTDLIAEVSGKYGPGKDRVLVRVSKPFGLPRFAMHKF